MASANNDDDDVVFVSYTMTDPARRRRMLYARLYRLLGYCSDDLRLTVRPVQSRRPPKPATVSSQRRISQVTNKYKPADKTSRSTGRSNNANGRGNGDRSIVKPESRSAGTDSRWWQLEQRVTVLLDMRNAKLGQMSAVAENLSLLADDDESTKDLEMRSRFSELSLIVYRINKGVAYVMTQLLAGANDDDQCEARPPEIACCSRHHDKSNTQVSSSTQVPSSEVSDHHEGRDICERCSTVDRCLQTVNQSCGTQYVSIAQLVADLSAIDEEFEHGETDFDPLVITESRVSYLATREAFWTRRNTGVFTIPAHKKHLEPEVLDQWGVFEHRVEDAVKELGHEMYVLGVYSHSRPEQKNETLSAQQIAEQRRKIKPIQNKIKGIMQEALAVHAGDARYHDMLHDEDEGGLVDFESLLCSRCGGVDEEDNDIVACDHKGCDRVYHQLCMDPPVPIQMIEGSETWWCHECETLNNCLKWINDACGTEAQCVEDLFPGDPADLDMKGDYDSSEDEDYDPDADADELAIGSAVGSSEDEWEAYDESLVETSGGIADVREPPVDSGSDDDGEQESSEGHDDEDDYQDLRARKRLRKSTQAKHVGRVVDAESDSSLSDEDFRSGDECDDYVDLRNVLKADPNAGRTNKRKAESSKEPPRGKPRLESIIPFPTEAVSVGIDQAKQSVEEADDGLFPSRRALRSTGGELVDALEFEEDYEETDSEAEETYGMQDTPFEEDGGEASQVLISDESKNSAVFDESSDQEETGVVMELVQSHVNQ